MGLEWRGSKQYYYRKRREGKRVISEYCGGGKVAQTAQNIYGSMALVERCDQEIEQEFADSYRLPEMQQYHAGITGWLDAQMAERGYRRHRRGEWRKVKPEILQAVPEPTLLHKYAQTALLDRYTMEPGQRKAVLSELEQRRSAILAEGSSVIEQVLACRIALEEAHVNYLQNSLLCTTAISTRALLDRELNSAQMRLLRSVNALAKIRGCL